ncbi:putative RNA polymerase II subunit B1 CTD phosphatase rpap2 [Stegastes partitus]|uniref:RNA polymerase II subunit B1 CTD phosphatase RPAP2 homolog n=1 Tax=Stegastes partitus TaxID=144197 RepID=A0A3B4Z3K6_9TELE|nr:PREDICTED: putative RNA polymerase II subunit B1 CTD phosphatase RPAP2 [Stegastes partitus]
MAAEERRRTGGSAKTSKKGGKRMKALTAEEEARRREEVKERLREKLELEKRALKVVERLLEDSVAEDFLVDCAKFIAPANYKDTIEERSIAKLCGYPICPNKLGKIPTQQYKISTKTNKVYDITERKCFCSNFCYKASKEFELQISKTPLWLRQHESPPEIKLLKKGDCGSSGEEVKLSERCLKEEDIENPLAAQPEDLSTSQQRPAAAEHSDSSDGEQEQDFVSSVVSQQQRPRVHWGDLPKRTDGDGKGAQGDMERRSKQARKGSKEEMELYQQQNTEKEGQTRKEVRTDAEKPKQLHRTNTDQAVKEQKDLPDEASVEEATAKLNLCSLSETVNHNISLPVESTPQGEHTPSLTSPSVIESKPPTESKRFPSSANQNSHNTALANQAGLNITQVGMSKRGAAGLRDLLKTHAGEAKPDTLHLNLLEGLRATLKEWCTDETLKFLYGADHSLGSPFVDVQEEKEEVEDELDEDDLEDDVIDAGEQKKLSAAAPDYETLKRDTQQLELRVSEFYKGTWVLPEEVQEVNGNPVTVQDQRTKDPVLPLIDSQAQHLIQKRITVEKLTSCLRNIVGPLHLTVSDVSTDLNNLVRTFRFTNTNIIHRAPEWTLLAVVLLHLLSEVSPLVREALETSASVEYLNTLMEELGVQEQDLLSLVQPFKTPQKLT